jgi:hypothetical protein
MAGRAASYQTREPGNTPDIMALDKEKYHYVRGQTDWNGGEEPINDLLNMVNEDGTSFYENLGFQAGHCKRKDEILLRCSKAAYDVEQRKLVIASEGGTFAPGEMTPNARGQTVEMEVKRFQPRSYADTADAIQDPDRLP